MKSEVLARKADRVEDRLFKLADGITDLQAAKGAVRRAAKMQEGGGSFSADEAVSDMDDLIADLREQLKEARAEFKNLNREYAKTWRNERKNA